MAQEIITIVQASDRIIWMQLEGQDLIGINYMQGAGDLEHFEDFKKNDELLMETIHKLIDYPLFKYMNYINRIDEIIWLHQRLISD